MKVNTGQWNISKDKYIVYRGFNMNSMTPILRSLRTKSIKGLGKKNKNNGNTNLHYQRPSIQGAQSSFFQQNGGS